MKETAILSSCDMYRYELRRQWNTRLPNVMFIMLNPSTACTHTNDLTTIRCINFAKRWGFGGIMIGNIYPFRAKRPKDLKKWRSTGDWNILDAYEDNKDYVHKMAREADLIVCAWGGNYKGLPKWINELSKDTDNALHYLELCDDGITPKHPLGNLSNDLNPIRYTQSLYDKSMII